MLDDMLSYVEHIRQQPVWQPIPPETRARFQEPLPYAAGSLAAAHQSFVADVLPYAVGNVHPGFMGWVHGGGTPVGMVADMLAAGLNANVGGRDQMPVEVERQVVRWMRELFRFPETASGIFVTGTSMANLMAVLVARTAVLGTQVRQTGLQGPGMRLVAYTSAAAHGCIARAMDLSGLGTAALRRIRVNAHHQIDVAALQAAIAADRAAGLQPFFIAATAGTVDVGAIDDLTGVAELAQRTGVWFHVDGAYAALGMLAPDIAPLLAGIERADSLAFDFHKWGQVPYDAGFLLVREASTHLAAFAAPAAYLRREARGLAAGSPWPCDFGPDLSRGFRALKTWFTFKVYGATRLGQVISETCRLARYLAAQVEASSELELMAPVTLNIVCFRFRCADSDSVNRTIVADLQESGIAVPSTTTIDGQLAIRAAIVNHRTMAPDIDILLAAVIAIGGRLVHDSLPDTLRAAAVAFAPLIGVARLARRAFLGEDLAPLATALLARAQAHPTDANAMLDCSTVLQLRGNHDLAMSLQAEAVKTRALYSLPSHAPGRDLRLLVLMGPGDLMANTPIEFLVEDSDVSLDLLYLTLESEWPEIVPDHDVLLVAIGESEANQPLLRRVAGALDGWSRSVINRPERIAVLTRDGVYGALRDIPGVAMPTNVRTDRDALRAIGDGRVPLATLLPEDDFPLIVRPIGSHAGQGLEKIEAASDIAAYLGRVDAERLYVSPFVDYRGPDGVYRKYRIALIEGRPFVCHYAMSTHWNIAYFNAGMAESAAKRAEEAECMAHFDEQFAVRHAAALRAIDERMGLSYVALDCAETRAGELL
ncbi:MAG TPA: pyridoxal-dependent decarboxylase, partial [Chloroflexota bacterium]|nr:pyridoxal-dependent decarboxylase [Chloroflexota bacterium]